MLYCIILVLGIGTLIPSQVRAGTETGTGTVLRVGLELTDGSYLIGLPGVSNIAIRTSYTDLQVNLEHISRVTVIPKDRTVSVELRNGDRITGTLEMPEMRIESPVGNVLIRREHIVGIRVLSGGALDAQFMNGLVLHYAFDSGDRLAADSGSGERHGMVNGAKYAENGKRNGAADFDGRTAYITSPAIDTQKDVTWSVWFKARSLPRTHDAYAQIMGLRGKSWVWNSDNTSISFCYRNDFEGAPLVLAFIIQGQTKSTFLALANRLDAMVWHHVAGVSDGTGTTLYLDGKLVARNHESVRFGSPTALIIGANDNGPQRYFDGLIDEVMVFERAFSEDEVRQLYENQK